MHSFFKKCFVRSSLDTIWWYVLPADFQATPANISHEIVPSEEHAKHCFKNEWTLEVTFTYFTGKYPTLVSEVR